MNAAPKQDIHVHTNADKVSPSQLTGGCIMEESRAVVLRKLTQAVDVIRTVDDKMPLQALSTLLVIAQNEGKTVSEIQKLAGLEQSSASRNVAMLSDWAAVKDSKTGKHAPGLKLVEYRQDITNFTKKTVYLQPKGKRLVDSIVLALTGGK